MVEKLENLIIKIHEMVGDRFTIVGTMSMRLNGYDIIPRKNEIDVCVYHMDDFNKIRTMGENRVNRNGDRTPFNEDIRSFITTEDGYIDLYYYGEEITHNVITLKGIEVKVGNHEHYTKLYCSIMNDFNFDKYDPNGKFKEKILSHINFLDIDCF